MVAIDEERSIVLGVLHAAHLTPPTCNPPHPHDPTMYSQTPSCGQYPPQHQGELDTTWHVGHVCKMASNCGQFVGCRRPPPNQLALTI